MSQDQNTEPVAVATVAERDCRHCGEPLRPGKSVCRTCHKHQSPFVQNTIPCVMAFVGLGGFLLSLWQANQARLEKTRAEQAQERASDALEAVKKVEASVANSASNADAAAHKAESALKLAEGASERTKMIETRIAYISRANSLLAMWASEMEESPIYFGPVFVLRGLLEKTTFPNSMALTAREKQFAKDRLTNTRQMATGSIGGLDQYKREQLNQTILLLEGLAAGLFAGQSLDQVIANL